MAPVLEELAKEFEGKLNICKVDTENGENGMLVMEYSVMSIPNMKLFKGGKVIEDFIGFRPAGAFSQELKKFL
jgi:thioredoxin 1